jgi:hypothetical protein
VQYSGQVMFPTAAAVQKRFWYDAGRGCPVTVTAAGFEPETVVHDRLPLRTMRARPSPFVASLPVDHQVGDFVRNGIFQKIWEVLCQKLAIEAKTRCAIAINPCLTGAAAAQREVDRCLRQIDAVERTGSHLCHADGCFCQQGKFQFWLSIVHWIRWDKGLCPFFPGILTSVGTGHKGYRPDIMIS